MTAASAASTKNSRAKKRLDAGDAGEIQVVALDQLKVDHLYQRDVNAIVVEKIAREWDIVTAGTIVVSKRANGDLFVVDGQHRVLAAKLAGESEILAQIVEGLSAAEEAELRLKGNYKKTDRIGEAFRARIFAGDEVAVGMQFVAGQFDTRFNFSPDAKHGINAISAAESVYRTDGGSKLVVVFALLHEAFGELFSDTASSNLIKATAWFVDRHTGESDRGRLVERMRIEGAQAVARMARNHKVALGGSLWLNTYRALVEVYNQGLREQNRLEWRTNRSTLTYGSWDK